MRRFRFHLESVATLRAMRELRAREHLAAAIRACEQAEADLAEASGRRILLEHLLRTGRAFTLRAAEHVAFLAALRRACDDETAAQRRVAEARAGRDRRLTEYHEAVRDVKVLGNLRTRARAAHRLALERESQTALDERASIAAARAARLLS
ncbi:MAG: flagellar FliJ family protein [Opitutaceae bacterium]|nr:flagellar FliJ family protein [Opitutaceae bacterium]